MFSVKLAFYEFMFSVSLQPFEYDPSEKNKHKFMVQSMFAPDGEIDQDKLWKDADSNEMMDSKLKCVFVMPAGAEQKYVTEVNYKYFYRGAYSPP